MSNSLYTKNQKSLAAKLRKARIAAKLTQAVAANKLRRSQSYISKVEMGQIRIDVPTLKKFSTLYRKKINDFLR